MVESKYRRWSGVFRFKRTRMARQPARTAVAVARRATVGAMTRPGVNGPATLSPLREGLWPGLLNFSGSTTFGHVGTTCVDLRNIDRAEDAPRLSESMTDPSVRRGPYVAQT
jgi:hypothetical protein